MADLLGMDPARIERLRSPERLTYLDPARLWEVLAPVEAGVIADIGAGVGFLTLPFARRFPRSIVYACDILEGMVDLLREDAAERGLGNLVTILMAPNAIDLPGDSADFIVMGQVHHELDAPKPLLAECKRLLKSGGTIAIVDWADAENGKSPPGGRRVPVSRMRADLEDAEFGDIETHDVYEYHTFMTGKA